GAEGGFRDAVGWKSPATKGTPGTPKTSGTRRPPCPWCPCCLWSPFKPEEPSPPRQEYAPAVYVPIEGNDETDRRRSPRSRLFAALRGLLGAGSARRGRHRQGPDGPPGHLPAADPAHRR